MSDLLAGRLEGDRAATPRASVASPTRTVPGCRDGLQAAAVLTRSPATMPWFVRAEGDGRLAGQDAGPRLGCAEPEAADRVDQVQAGADGPLGVVLVRGRACPRRP